MSFIEHYFNEVGFTVNNLSKNDIETITNYLKQVRENDGRVFILGVGGSAANASHMVNDLRKLCNIEAYSPIDNVSELTARVNDEGWEYFFERWLTTSKLTEFDCIFVLSVGGGSQERNISVNLIRAINLAHDVGAAVLSIVGKPDGYAAMHSDACCVIPVSDQTLLTPISEAFQAVVWHCIVSHPELQTAKTTW